MRAVLKQEIHKAICNKMFLLSVCVGCLLVLLSMIYNVAKYYGNLVYVASVSTDFYAIYTVFNRWLGGEAFSLGSAIYFYIFPLLVALPYGWSYCEEKTNGYRRMMVTRCGKGPYLFSKYAAAFLSGGLAMSLPLMLSFAATAMFIPMGTPFPMYCEYYGVFADDLMAELYYTQPLMYVALYICLDFVFAGLIACLSVVFSAVVKYRVFSVILPMFVCLAVHYMRQYAYLPDVSANYHEISPLYFLRGMETAYSASWGIIIAEAMMILVVLLIAGIRERRSEIY